MIESFPIARYRLSFNVSEPLLLPDYAGSTLRGVFGRALMQLSGLSISDIKNKSPIFSHSSYAKVFEPQPEAVYQGLIANLANLPVPYVIEAPLSPAKTYSKGELFSFNFVLIDKALDHLPVIILAWRRALLMGLGKNKQGKAELITVEHLPTNGQSQVIFTQEKPSVMPHKALFKWPQYKQATDINLEFVTPLRIQQQGKILNSSQLNSSLFLRSLIRRVSIYIQLYQPTVLTDEHIHQLNKQADKITSTQQLTYKKWARYSKRQHQLMQMDGLLGSWQFFSIPPNLRSFLELGELLHLGKGTSFGLGGYLIKEAKND